MHLIVQKLTRLVPVFALLLSGCIGGGDRERTQQSASRTQAPVNTASLSLPTQACFGDLQNTGASFTPVPDQRFSGGCTTINSLRLTDIGTATTNLGPMTCPLARNFVAWVNHAVKPAARQVYGEEIVRVETMGTYACRTVNGNGPTNRLSQHAHANAVDVSAFVMSDGTRVVVRGGWNGDARSQRFLRLVHSSACRRFGTVLSPDYNAAHHDHFHFDMSGNGFCR